MAPKRKEPDASSRDQISHKKNAKNSPSSVSLLVYDSDVEPGEEPVADRTSWRLPPEESLSDWKLEVVSKNRTDTYYVHKHVLALGPRRSEYFARLFSEGGRFAESSNSTSRLELHELQAEHFDKLLDYLYCPGVAFDATCESVVALHSLACYLDIHRLRFQAKKFCRDKMSSESCATFYEHAKILNDEKILKCVTDFACLNADVIGPDSRIVQIADAEFWLQILEENKDSFMCTYLSKLIAAFFQSKIVDASIFEKMTSQHLLPEIDSSAALALIDAERRFVAPAEKSSLQERCLVAMKQKWKDIDFESTQELNLVKEQNSAVLAELVSHIAGTAKQELHVHTKLLERLRERHARDAFQLNNLKAKLTSFAWEDSLEG